jgi:hypothetical protein
MSPDKLRAAVCLSNRFQERPPFASNPGSDSSLLMKLRRRFGLVSERNQRHALFPRFQGAPAWVCG